MSRLAVALLLALLSGCGYVGDPQPPLINIPSSVEDLRALQRGDRILVEFTLPQLTTEGVQIEKPVAIDLRIGSEGGSPFNADAWASTASRISPSTQTAERVTADIPAAPWAGKEVFLAVKVTGDNGRSLGWSNFAALQVQDPLAAPAAMMIANTPAGVQLSWQSKAAAHRIFRAPPDGDFEMIASGVASPWVDTTAAAGTTYRYRVQAIRPAGTQEAESEMSAVASIAAKDLAPPAMPASLRAVAGLKTIELAWDANREPDLAGYRLYRSDGGDWQRAGADLAVPAFSDAAIESGKSYRYAVTAFDANGNESPRTAPVEIAAP